MEDVCWGVRRAECAAEWVTSWLKGSGEPVHVVVSQTYGWGADVDESIMTHGNTTISSLPDLDKRVTVGGRAEGVKRQEQGGR